jgi:hypothetical protein
MRIGRASLTIVLLAGCGGAPGVSAMQLAVDNTSGLRLSQIGSVAVLVLEGDHPDCAHATALRSPLDDPSLKVDAHALFAVDGTPQRVTGIPAGAALLFYVDAYATPDGSHPRIGRGCTETMLTAGQESAVSITLTAAPDN